MLNRQLSIINKILLLVQWVLIALPLPGYIHPDEFFQSTEIMGSDILGVKAHRTWEWNNTEPARNIIFPVVSSGLPFVFLKWMSQYLGFFIGTQLVVIAPRIMMGFITIATDYVLKKLASKSKQLNEKLDVVLFLFRSSHVTLVFLNRTFSNGLELLLFSILLYIIMVNRERLFSSTFWQMRLGAVLITTFFIRQTILAFVFYPLVHLAICLLMECFAHGFVKTLSSIFKCAFMVVLGVLIGFSVCILADHYYFSNGENSWHLTPWNLIKYNNNIENLKLHGVHPWYLHGTVNMFLLFGPLYIIFLYGACSLFTHIFPPFNLCNEKTHLLLNVITAVGILSLVPHHEPRYLIPVIVPLILFIVLQCPNLEQSKVFMLSWVIFNMLGVLWFGFLHQAGILPSLVHIHSKIQNQNLNTTVIFWKTYSVPEHLLLLQKDQSYVKIHDFAGNDWSFVESKIRSIQISEQILLVCPSTVFAEIPNTAAWSHEFSFFPHVTTEDLPKRQFLDMINFKKLDTGKPLSMDALIDFLKDSFSLNIYKYVGEPA